MNQLAEKIRKARQSRVQSGAFTFIITRPTDIEMLEFRGQKLKQRDILELFVVGWEGFKESDLYSGGTGEPVEFNAEIWKEWIADRPEHWTPITNAIIESYKQHEMQMEESSKN